MTHSGQLLAAKSAGGQCIPPEQRICHRSQRRPLTKMTFLTPNDPFWAAFGSQISWRSAYNTGTRRLPTKSALTSGINDCFTLELEYFYSKLVSWRSAIPPVGTQAQLSWHTGFCSISRENTPPWVVWLIHSQYLQRKYTKVTPL